MAARANYLALDRPDIAFATKELCRCFACPNGQALEALKRPTRYLIGARRVIWDFRFQHMTDQLTTSVDTDFAGCLSTRRSTSGGAAMRGSHLLRHWSLTQTTVTLSSAEADLGGITRGASNSMGLRSIACDLGFHWQITIQTDSTAAVGICRRRGLGKIRHLAAADLWVQDRLRTKDFSLVKVLGTDNVADMLTKHVPRPVLCKHMASMGLKQIPGRAELAPQIENN